MRWAEQWSPALWLVVPPDVGAGQGVHGTQQESDADPVSRLHPLFSAETASPPAIRAAVGQHG